MLTRCYLFQAVHDRLHALGSGKPFAHVFNYKTIAYICLLPLNNLLQIFFTIKQPFKDVIHTFINAYNLETLDNLSQRFVIIRQPSKDIVNHKKISQIFCLLENLSQTLLTISPNHSQMFKKN